MMFKEKPINKLYAFALAVVFAIALAGCGGGGGGAADDTMTGPTPAEMAATAANEAVSAASDAVATLTQMSTDEEVAAATAAITAAKVAAMHADLTAEDAAAATAAIGEVETALAAANSLIATYREGEAAKMQVAALQEQINNLRAQLGLGADDNLSDSITDLQQQAADLQQRIQDEQDAEDKAAMEAMMATAMKLHAGIGDAPLATATGRLAVYNGDNIDVTTASGGTAVPLSEDKDATVAANHGWEGKKYTAAPTDDGTYEAVVYSNVGEPTPGAKFSVQYTGNITEGVLDEATTEGTASRVASPSFDQSAGVKSFELPTNNVAVMISGSYHGVSGTYSCVPGTGNKCAVRVAASGFDLGGVITTDNTFAAGNAVWTFKPTNPDALLMSTPDAIYASYGWWIHKSADGNTFTASTFAVDNGAVTPASGVTALRGTATYMGGAAGKYALYSATGGTNDAGHFTARATLEADFNADTITGTIDNFMGADGEARDWSVELKKSAIADGGAITNSSTTASDGNQMTVWTIGGTAADAGGEWSGALKENGADSVPSVATGTFHSTYSTGGQMVGGFGANKQ